MTSEEGIAKAKTKWWEKATAHEIVQFQLFEPILCCPFSIFHGAVELVLKRPVYTHEFGSVGTPRLQDEFLGKAPRLTFEGSMDILKKSMGEK